MLLFVRVWRGCPAPPAPGQGRARGAVLAGLFVMGIVQGRETHQKDGFSSNKKRDSYITACYEVCL